MLAGFVSVRSAMTFASRAVAALLSLWYAAGLSAQHSHDGIMYHAPRWSPDGQWILASANRDGDTEIYLVRADGGELRQLTRNNVADDGAQWSNDGRRIVFQSERSGMPARYSMNPDGSDPRPEPADSVVARSPDGATLIFESVRDGRARLFAMRADRTGVREIVTARYSEQPGFSPDEKMIVF